MLQVFVAAGAAVGAFVGAKLGVVVYRQARWAFQSAVAREAKDVVRDASVCESCRHLIPRGDARFFTSSGPTAARCGACGPPPGEPEPKPGA